MLAEVAVTLLVLSLALVALVPVFALNIKSGKSSERAQAANWLTQELMDEIRMRKWDENTPSPAAYAVGSTTLGPETGEGSTDKRNYDDIDDFNGWSESPAVDPTMQTITGFAGYRRYVTVAYVNSSDLSASGSTTDYKKITVCTEVKGRPDTCLSTLVVNH